MRELDMQKNPVQAMQGVQGCVGVELVRHLSGANNGERVGDRDECEGVVIVRVRHVSAGEMEKKSLAPHLHDHPFPQVLKQEYTAASRHYTLGAIALDQNPGTLNGADVGQNHQVGAFFGGQNPPSSRLIFGDSGSVNCSDPAFQRHTFSGITSRLVAGALAITRPKTAKINPCPRDLPGCANSDFPLFAFVSADLAATRTKSGDWVCFNAANETFACLAITGNRSLTTVACTHAWPFWNGSLLLFNGSSSSNSVGVMQMGTRAQDGSFEQFVEVMATKKIVQATDKAGNVRYDSLRGGLLEMGVGGVLPLQNQTYTYRSPFISGVHSDPMEVHLNFPNYETETLTFDASLTKIETKIRNEHDI